MTSEIFSSSSLGGIPLRNKIIRSATHEGMADERGRPTEQLKTLYARLAKGGVGAIISGYAGIHQEGRSALYRMLMIDGDDCVASYKELVDAVHSYRTPIILQVAHCGRQTRSKLTGTTPVAPSAIRDKLYSEEVPRELTDIEINAVIDRFVLAIGRAKEAGFDGVQLLAAHGHLLSQFLSPYTNRRSDRWGGTIENRYRMLGEIFRRSRSLMKDYPLLAKINAYDNRKNGVRIEDAVSIARLLQASGCSGIEVSCGVFEDGFFLARAAKLPFEAMFAYHFRFKKMPALVKGVYKRFGDMVVRPVKPLANYNVEAANEIKKAVTIPVIAVGGIRSIADIGDIIADGKADYVSMCRPFIIEPNIVDKFERGKQTTSKCIDCCFCVIAGEERPLRCYYGKLRRGTE